MASGSFSAHCSTCHGKGAGAAGNSSPMRTTEAMLLPQSKVEWRAESLRFQSVTHLFTDRYAAVEAMSSISTSDSPIIAAFPYLVNAQDLPVRRKSSDVHQRSMGQNVADHGEERGRNSFVLALQKGLFRFEQPCGNASPKLTGRGEMVPQDESVCAIDERLRGGLEIALLGIEHDEISRRL